MKVGIMGFGTVGCGAYKIAKAADGIEIAGIFSRRLRPEYEPMLEEDGNIGLFTTEPERIWQNDSIDVVIESMGGVEPARKYVLACLNSGKHVVTPNKNLISACYDELMEAADRNGVQLRFTATAGGGIPWLFNLSRTTRCDTIKEVRGIVNGTCNYILDAMHTNGDDYADILKKAQELGYAEADPAADVEGTDTLRKTVISANIAFGTVIKEEDVPCFGIDTIEKRDIDWFNEHGYTCKLMMNAKTIGDGSEIAAYVEPTLFPAGSLEANVRTNMNLITLVGESIGTQSFYGQGAGMLATGESVIQDVIDIKEGGSLKKTETRTLKVNNAAEKHKYYIRQGEKAVVTSPVSVEEMNRIAETCKENNIPLFYAAIVE